MSQQFGVPHQTRIALDTLKLHKLGAKLMGGMTHVEAVNHLRSVGMTELEIESKLFAAGHSAKEIVNIMAK